MRDHNFQMGGVGNIQKIINNQKQKSWQDNIFYYVIVGVIITVIGYVALKYLGLL